jgi:tRNA1Val (adenine37-N6)-methyltransferase
VTLAPPPGPPAPEDADRSDLFGGAVRCWQPRRGYRFSVDALLLAMSAFDEPGETVLELGTGVGVVLLVLALNPRRRRLVGLELQPALAALARRNVADAGERGRVTIVEGDLRDPPPDVRDERFDLVVSNPPYYPLTDGHLNPDSQRAIARHEVTCRIDDVLARARAAVAPTGRVLLVYPAPRAAALQAAAPAAGLDVAAVQLVRSRPTHAPRQVLVALAPARLGAPPPVPQATPVLDLHDQAGAHQGPLADFFRRIERLAALRGTSE